MARSYLKATLLSLLLCSSSYADFLGGELSLGAFNHSPSGDAAYDFGGTGSEVSVEDTLHWENAQNIVTKAYLEHPMPFIPNVKLGYTNFSYDGSGEVSAFQWGEITAFNGDIKDSMNLDITDITLYYELLDNWVSVDTGLTMRYLEGEISIVTQNSNLSQEESVIFDTWLPMVYMKSRFDFPFTDLSIQAEANIVSYSGTTMYDAEASIRYTAIMGLGIEGGYKTVHLSHDDLVTDLEMDVDFSGPYAAIVWDF